MSSCDKLSIPMASVNESEYLPVIEQSFAPGMAGQLELMIEACEMPVALAVLCHPHSQYGGSMHDAVLDIISEALLALNVTTVRFNFRGVGDSQGDFDDGEGEVHDVLSVVNWASERWPGLPVILGGYSFGAAMALIAAARIEDQISKLILIAPPIQMMESDDALSIDSCIIVGGRDTIVSASAAAQYFGSGQLIILPQEDHFFAGAKKALTQHIRAFMNGA